MPGAFELAPGSGAKLATADKSLFDLFCLAPGRSRLFAIQPELAIPRRFEWARLGEYAARVQSVSRRSYVAGRVKAVRATLPSM